MSRPADPNAKIALLRASEAAFAEHGLAAAKVEEIARRAGLSKGAFYLHFDSKEEAFKQVVESFLARCGALHAPPSASDDAPATPGEMLDFWLERDTQMFEFLWQNRAIVTMLDGCQGPNAYLVDSFRQSMMACSSEWIEFFKKHHFVRPELDTDVVTTILWGAYNELSRRLMTFPRKPPILAWLRQALSIFLRGLGTPALVEVLRATEDAEDPPVSQRITPRPEDARGARRRTRAGRS